MKKALLVIVLVFCASLFATADPITVQVYGSVPHIYGSAVVVDSNWLNPFAPFTISNINFTNPFAGFPGGLVSDGTNAWGALFTGTFYASVAGDYVFNMFTDDGATLSVNGSVTGLNDPTAHGPAQKTATIHLNAGANAFSLAYYEWNGNPAVLQLVLPEGVSYTPEPSSLLMLGTGLIGAAGALFRKMRLTV